MNAPVTLEEMQQRLQGRSAAVEPISTPSPAPTAPVSLEQMQARLSPQPERQMGALSNAGNAFVQGASDVASGLPKSAGIIGAAMPSGPEVLTGYDIWQAMTREGAGEAALDRVRTAREAPKPRPQDTPLYKAGQALADTTREAFPTDPSRQGDFLADTLPRGAGSMVGFVGASAAGSLVGIPPLLTAGGLGASVGGAQGFDDAAASGATTEEQYQSFLLNAGLGTTEAVPIATALDRLDKATGGGVKKILKQGFKGGVEELLQETVQSVGGNLIANSVVAYDPDRGTFDGTIEQGGAGFTLGSSLNMLTSFIGQRRAMKATPDNGNQAPISEAPPAPVAPIPEATTQAPGPVQQPGSPPTLPPIAPGIAAPQEVRTPSGRVVPTGVDLVEADALVTSNKDDLTINPAFPMELQPRDRTRVGSADQITEIATRLDPELLGPFAASTAEGAPIIGPDNVVESGNARTLAIRRAYSQHPESAQRYKEYLQRLGLNVSGMTAPVLVRRRTSDMTPFDRAGFVREANERTTLEMGASERAASDARVLNDAVLELFDGNSISAASNRPFVRQVLQSFPQAERGGMLDQDGSLNQEGERRIENALFARAYEAPDVLATLREDSDSNIRGLGGALTDAAGAWAQMRALARAGAIPADMDLTSDLVQAVRIVRQARRNGRTVADEIGQVDAFNGAMSPGVRAILALMFRDGGLGPARSRGAVAQAVRAYATEASKNRSGASLLGENAQLSSQDILSTVQTSLAQRDARSQVAPVTLQQMQARLAQREAPQTMQIAAPGPLTLEQMQAKVTKRNQTVQQPQQAPAAAQGPLTLQQMQSRMAMAPGASHTGMRKEITATGAQEFGGEVRRENVLAPFFKALGVPYYVGRVKGKGVKGFYKVGIEEIRLKHMNDLEVAAHEVAHLLDDRMPEISKTLWKPGTPAFRKELRGVSYDETKLFEGWAEFVRLWMTQPNEAASRAPLVNAWMSDFVAGNQEYGPLLVQTKQRMLEWFEQDALQRARSKIGPLDKDVSETFRGFGQRFRQGVLDDLQGISNMERSLTNGDAQGLPVYETARLTRAKHSIIEGAMTLGAPVVLPDGSHGFKGKSLQAILEPVAADLETFWTYGVGKAAQELKGQGREHLFTSQEIAAMTALETPAFRKAFADYQVWNNAILDFAEAKGVLNPDARRRFKRAQYLPFYRVSEGRGATANSRGGTPGNVKPIQALTGGTGNLRDIQSNVIQSAAVLIDTALTNEARLQVANLSKQKGGAAFMVQIPAEEKSVSIDKGQIVSAVLDSLGVSRRNQLPPAMQSAVTDIVDGLAPFTDLVQRNQAPAGSNVVAVLRGGKPEYYEVADPLLYRSLTSLNRPYQSLLMQIIGAPKRIGQATITLSPDFMAANFARDQLMGGIMSKHGFKPLLDGLRGMKSRLVQDATYKEFIANGGGFSSNLANEAAFRRRMETFYGRKGINYQTVMDVPAKLLDGLERVADSVEMATRLGEYKRARSQGALPRRAAFQAREVSTDFAMRGDDPTANMLYDSIIFLKAAAVSLDRSYRAFTQDGHKGKVMAKTALLAAASAALYALNSDNPLYDELEEWDRDTHWHFFVPTAEYYAFRDRMGRGPITPKEAAPLYTHLRMPKIWEIGAISTVAERSVAGVLNGDMAAEVPRMASVLTGIFKVEYLPQIIAPLYEQAINRIRFLDRPIENQSMKELAPWARAGGGTSPSLRALGEAVRDVPLLNEVSPARAEALIRGYLNTWGGYGLTLADAALLDDAPDLRPDQYPVLRRFIRSHPVRSSRHMSELYEAINESVSARRTMRAMIKSDRPEIADDLALTPENATYKQTQTAQKVLKGFRNFTNAIYAADTLQEVQALAQTQAQQIRDSAWIGRVRLSPDWQDIGALKAVILESVTHERNDFARQMLAAIKESRQAARHDIQQIQATR